MRADDDGLSGQGSLTRKDCQHIAGRDGFLLAEGELLIPDSLRPQAGGALLLQVADEVIHRLGRACGANIAAFNMNLWLHTLIELWAWRKPQKELTDRAASPWDDATRRPSHADRRNALRRQCLHDEISPADLAGPMAERFQQLWNQLVNLAA